MDLARSLKSVLCDRQIVRALALTVWLIHKEYISLHDSNRSPFVATSVGASCVSCGTVPWRINLGLESGVGVAVQVLPKS